VIVLAIPLSRPGAWNGKSLRDIALGFVGWFLLNTLLWSWVDASISRSSGAAFWQLERLGPPLVNMIALPVLFRTRRWVTLGVFSAILVNAIGTVLVTPVTDFYGNNTFTRIIAMIPFFMAPFFPNL
jgi:hypothetical protein